jgi:hypothetical protein
MVRMKMFAFLCCFSAEGGEEEEGVKRLHVHILAMHTKSDFGLRRRERTRLGSPHSLLGAAFFFGWETIEFVEEDMAINARMASDEEKIRFVMRLRCR